MLLVTIKNLPVSVLEDEGQIGLVEKSIKYAIEDIKKLANLDIVGFHFPKDPTIISGEGVPIWITVEFFKEEPELTKEEKQTLGIKIRKSIEAISSQKIIIVKVKPFRPGDYTTHPVIHK